MLCYSEPPLQQSRTTSNCHVQNGSPILVTVPASPFAGRLLAEIAKVQDGVPAAAAEMGVTPEVVDAIANSEPVSTDDLNAVYASLVDRITLRPEEAKDYRQMQTIAREGTH